MLLLFQIRTNIIINTNPLVEFRMLKNLRVLRAKGPEGNPKCLNAENYSIGKNPDNPKNRSGVHRTSKILPVRIGTPASACRGSAE